MPASRNRRDDIASALAALNHALQGARRRPRRSRPAPVRTAGPTLAALRTAEVGRMVAAPWRIVRAVYPWRPATWPVPDRTRDDVLLDCRSYLAAARTLATPWGFDANRLIALEQAEAALIAMATAESDPSRRAGRDACRDLGAACARPADDA